MIHEHDNTQTPDVNHVVVAFLAFLEDLRGDIVRSPAQGSSPNGVHILASDKQCSQPKVPNLGIHVLVQENVAHLQVTVDDSLAVHVLDSAGNLDGIESDLGFRQALSPFDHIHKRPIRTQLQDEIGAVFKRERPVELDDVLLLHL